MKSIVCAGFVILLLGCGAGVEGQLVGKWKNKKTKAEVEYVAGGTVILVYPEKGERSASSFNGTYSFIDKDRIKVEYKKMDPVILQIVIDGKTMTAATPEGHSETWERME